MKPATWQTQLRKGVLEMVLLLLVEEKELYGYELVKRVRDIADIETSEGTIYPILNRLSRDDFIQSRWIEQEKGIPRKYYRITAKGKEALDQMSVGWKTLVESMNLLLERR